MPPGTRRANRGGFADHDDFEGLPVRQWRLESVNVEPPLKQEQSAKSDIWDVELPYGMPKDSHLLPSHSLELLRAARSGRLYKRPAPVEEEEVDAEAVISETKEKKEEDTSSRGFSIKVWKQLPRNVEAPTISHLAKRRKGTITIASRTPADKIQGPTVTRATVRRIDAAGNPYTEEVMLGDNQHVEGEIISKRVEVAPAAGADSLSAPPPARRRPPIPKRKFKPGPGRGKKKLKIPLPGDSTVAGAPLVTGASHTADGTQGAVKIDGSDNNMNNDSELADGDENDDNDDNENEDNDDEDGDEGEDAEENNGDEQPESDQPDNGAGHTGSDQSQAQDHAMEDAAPVPIPVPVPVPVPAAVSAETSTASPDVDMKDDSPVEAGSLPNPMSLAPPLGGLARESPKIEGSPLKNISVASSPKESESGPELQPHRGEEQALEQTPALSTKIVSEVASAEAQETTPLDISDSMSGPKPEMGLSAVPGIKVEASPVEGSVMEEEEDIKTLAPPSLLEIVEDKDLSESVIAEPPSTIVGKAPDEATERDMPSKPPIKLTEDPSEEALLPPPPDQVGNIETPLSEEPPRDFPGAVEKVKEELPAGEESTPDRPPLVAFNSTLTEDSIKPDDSASVSASVNENTADIEDVGTLSHKDELAHDTLSAVAVVEEAAPGEESMREEEPKQSPPPPHENEHPAAALPAAATESTHIMGGLLNDLDRREDSISAPEETKPESPEAEEQPQASAAEAKPSPNLVDMPAEEAPGDELIMEASKSEATPPASTTPPPLTEPVSEVASAPKETELAAEDAFQEETEDKDQTPNPTEAKVE